VIWQMEGKGAVPSPGIEMLGPGEGSTEGRPKRGYALSSSSSALASMRSAVSKPSVNQLWSIHGVSLLYSPPHVCPH